MRHCFGQRGRIGCGAMVQFCSDEACKLGKTQVQGVAVFEVEEGKTYSVHILKTPEGYEKNDEEYTVEDVNSTESAILARHHEVLVRVCFRT